MTKVAAITLVLLTFMAGAAQSAPPGPEFHVKHYALRLAFDPASRKISGVVTITAVSRIPNLKLVRLNLVDAMKVANVSMSAKKLIFRQASDVVSVELPRVEAIGTPFELTVQYAGTPKNGSSFTFGKHGDVPMIASNGLPQSAQDWWPSLDTPADKADSAEIVLTVPGNLTAVSNGKLVAEKLNKDHSRTFTWAVQYPIYSDVVSVAITRYASFTIPYQYSPTKSMPMIFYVYPEDLAKAKAQFPVLLDIMKHHVEAFGPYPFLKEKYGVAEFVVHSYREHQTIPSFGENMITGDHTYDRVLAHELAHQWFGNATTVRNWSHIWLNEGFATYANLLWVESRQGKEAYRAMLDKINPIKMRAVAPMKPDGPTYIADPMNDPNLLAAATFLRGAWILHMLRHVMGDRLFATAIKQYVKKYSNGNADTEDFEHVCEAIYGKPLDWFFKEWVYGAGHPEYSFRWHADGAGTSVTIEQTQENLFRMPLDVRIKSSTGEKTVTWWIDEKVKTFQLPADHEVMDVVPDPDGWVLGTFKSMPSTAIVGSRRQGSLALADFANQ